ncbi:CoA-disulfide reductase [Paenibacillus lupini]|uniref:CoA-disulfide reductase n=1 Tax=Paenibacillus lupini TaxID=1450204 RepID=UPI00141FEFE9|nr:CoA-disulfide reductase [Paenibacillus lupini]NIK25237.1 NADPH-dependent 2,4-dienoyl-CoA reductase/sulfur reductase-like enzyme/peroxiredoxin family protein/rhodanese-related sulfurtransferase/TusA-related sulfurtransferase [Paenibacillus lupini]
MSKKVIIVGGVAGGASAAARLRRLDEEAHIVMFERNDYISFANCGLPYYIGGSIKERSKLLVQTPEAMFKRFNIDIRTQSEVVAINPAANTVTVRNLASGEQYEESYDQMILSPGAKPIRPNVPGADHTSILSLRNLADTDRIKEKVTQSDTKSAVVIGGGFIGIEMAENLKELGLEVTLVQSGDQILSSFDGEMSGMMAKELEDNGVKLLFKQQVLSFSTLEHNRVEVRLSSGMVVQTELVISAIGVTPDTAFVQGSGLAFGSRGHIVVNDRMETNLPNIYAVGDAVEVTDFVNGRQTAIPLAGPANKQGRIAADNVAGLPTTFKGTQGTSIIKVFGLTGAATGNNEKTLRAQGIPYQVTYVHPNSHAGYYPGAVPMTLKLLFNDEGRILGAQAVGRDGVDKRMDTISTVMRLKGTVTDLTELELAYAPPFSSAKDPVNMAGYTAENILSGLTDVFVTEQLTSRDEQNAILVDVRSKMEHDNGHIPGSILIPVDELRGRLDELDRNKEIWVYCQVGLRGYTASRILRQNGFKVRNLTGGYKTYLLTQYTPKKNEQPPVHAAAVKTVTEGLKETAAGILQADATLDACGLCCPGPLIQVKQQIDGLKADDVLKVTATDPGFYEDIQAWAGMTHNRVEKLTKHQDGTIEAFVRKGDSEIASEANQAVVQGPDNSTMIVFSGDLDKAIASFIIANGAASSGKKVTMFFTFWGLNVIRRPEKIPVSKNLIGRMFGMMMPRGSRKLSLSKMNMMGMGAKMIRGVMSSNNVSSLEELIETAISQGVEVVACQMSMDLMGIQKEELIDGVKIAGVGYYLGKADQSGINLFI